MIPCLLLRGDGLVKTVKFRDERYIGDPINAVRIFNSKRADELIFLDIDASKQKRSISLQLVEKIADETSMPFSVGGGICNSEQVRCILGAGAEKVVLNTHAVLHPEFIAEIATKFGSQSIVVSIDAKKKLLGKYETYVFGGTKGTGYHPAEWAVKMQEMGAGEIFLNSMDRDGTMSGYDLDLIKEVSDAVSIPVVACGGAASNEDLASAVNDGHATAVSAGSLFVYHGRKRAVLINFPTKEQLKNLFADLTYDI